MRVQHNLQRLFARSTEWMFGGSDPGFWVDERPIVGHPVDSVVADVVGVEFTFPVEERRDEWIRVLQD